MLNFIENFLFKIDLKVVSIWIRGNNGQDTDKAVRMLLLGGCADLGSAASSGGFYSVWVRSTFMTNVGFFTTVKLD